MKGKDLVYFENLLNHWLSELLAQADHTLTGLIGDVEALADPLDQAAFDTNRSFNLRIRDRESLLIKKIRQSLKDIENREYGICEMCGREISIERLKARPVARHCIACKTKMEKYEKLKCA